MNTASKIDHHIDLSAGVATCLGRSAAGGGQPVTDAFRVWCGVVYAVACPAPVFVSVPVAAGTWPAGATVASSPVCRAMRGTSSRVVIASEC